MENNKQEQFKNASFEGFNNKECFTLQYLRHTVEAMQRPCC